MKLKSNLELEKKALWVRQQSLEMAVRAGSGHVSTAFSQAELVVALYYDGILRYDPKNPKWDGRDRFILSKGQGGLGTYPALADLGFFPVEELQTFAGKGSRLGVHAEWNIPGIEVLTGSLGHGLPLASGIAYAAKHQKKDFLIVVILGDGELHEGSNWEALFTIGSKNLNNVICIIDHNRQCTIAYTDRIISSRDGPVVTPLDKKFQAWGFDTRTIDGHSFQEIRCAFSDVRERKDSRPLAIIAQTFKGYGSSIMSDRPDWHHKVPSGEDLDMVRQELKDAQKRLEERKE